MDMYACLVNLIYIYGKTLNCALCNLRTVIAVLNFYYLFFLFLKKKQKLERFM